MHIFRELILPHSLSNNLNIFTIFPELAEPLYKEEEGDEVFSVDGLGDEEEAHDKRIPKRPRIPKSPKRFFYPSDTLIKKSAYFLIKLFLSNLSRILHARAPMLSQSAG